jgi:thiosulfate/3-mercaptopyruvate sulfurtransferase
MLVSVEWLRENLKDVKTIEVKYELDGLPHIPTARLLHWKSILHPLKRDFAPREIISEVLSKLGISNDDTIILYSDLGNRYAFYAYWLLKAYGHEDVRILDGGIYKWLKEGFELEDEVKEFEKSVYVAKDPDWSNRIYVWELLSKLGKVKIIDTRSEEEYFGKITSPPEHPCENTQVSGHIPTAINIPWIKMFNEDYTLRKSEELKEIFQFGEEEEIVVYCRTGARASVVWYVLRELLGFKKVRLYDGSWSEYGNMVGVPIEK